MWISGLDIFIGGVAGECPGCQQWSALNAAGDSNARPRCEIVPSRLTAAQPGQGQAGSRSGLEILLQFISSLLLQIREWRNFSRFYCLYPHHGARFCRHTSSHSTNEFLMNEAVTAIAHELDTFDNNVLADLQLFTIEWNKLNTISCRNI